MRHTLTCGYPSSAPRDRTGRQIDRMRQWLPELRKEIGNAARCEQHSDE